MALSFAEDVQGVVPVQEKSSFAEDVSSMSKPAKKTSFMEDIDNAFGDRVSDKGLSDLIVDKPKETTSAGEAFGAHLLESVPSSVATVGAMALAETGLAVATGGVSIPVQIIGSAIAGIGAGYGTEKLTQAMLPEKTKKYLAKTEKEHPYASFAGEMASFPLAGGLSKPGSLKKAAALATVGGGLETAKEAAFDEKIDPIKILISSVAMPITGGKPTKLTRMVFPESMNKKVADALTTIRKVESETNPVTSQGLESVHKGKGATKATADTLDAIRANDHIIDTIVAKLNSLVPDLKLRKQMTVSTEVPLTGKQGDLLLGDEDKLRTLKSMEDVTDIYTWALSGGKTTRGAARELKPNTERFWQNYLKKNPDAVSHPGGQHGHLAEKLKGLEDAIEYRRSLGAKEGEHIGSEEEAIRVKKEMDGHIEEVGNKAVELGLMERLLKNYIPHVIDWSKFEGTKEEKIALQAALEGESTTGKKLTRDYTQHRKYRTIRDLEAVVRDELRRKGMKDTNLPLRGIKVERDYGKIYAAYMKAMGKAVMEKQLIDHLENLSIEGKPILSKDPLMVQQEKYQPFTSEESSPLKGYFVHPEYIPLLEHMWRQKDPGMIVSALANLTNKIKMLNTVGSLFHANNLTMARFLMAPKETSKAFMPGNAGVVQAYKDFMGMGGPHAKLTEMLMKQGLEVTSEDPHVAEGMITKLGQATDKILGTTAAEKGADFVDRNTLHRMNTWTWSYAHTGGKLLISHQLFHNIKGKNPHIPDEQIAKEVAKHVNDSLGGQNWLRIADQVQNNFLRSIAMKAYSKPGRQIMQMLMFAPDWTISAIRSGTAALPKSMNVKAGFKGIVNPTTREDLARRYVINTAILYTTLLNGLNYAFSGHSIMENKKDKTRVELGDGTSVQLAKHAMEIYEWIGDFSKTAGNKMSILPKAAVIATTGKAYPSPDAPMIKDNTTSGRIAAVLQQVLPFSVSAAANAPPGEAAKRAFLGVLGVTIYGQTDAQHSSANVRRERAIKRLETKKKKFKEQREVANK